MENKSFEQVYKKLCDKLGVDTKHTFEEDNILNNNPEYLKQKEQRNYEELRKEHELKTFDKVYNDVTYGVYMFKNSFTDLEVDENYRPKILPEIEIYETSMIVCQETNTGNYKIENILAIRDKDKNKVEQRYNEIVKILDTYSEQELLILLDNEIEKI